MAQVITYNITIDDTSPQVVYSPATLTTPEPDLNAGWNQFFTGIGFNSFPGQVGLQNESLHITNEDGANFTITFTGTAIQLYGLAIDTSFSVILDETQETSHTFSASRSLNTTTLLASFAGLEQQDHTLSFTVANTNGSNSSGFYFDRAVITASTGLTDAAVTIKMINDTDMQFTGSWTFVNDSTLIPEGNHSYHITQNAGDKAQYTFTGSSIELAGLTNASAGLFNVTLKSDTDPATIQQQQLSGLSSFLTYTTLFYASGLDANATHTLTITNIENKTLALDSMNITVVSGGESASSSLPSTQVSAVTGLSRGAIAGIAVAASLAVLFFLGILALLLCCYRRRRECARRRKEYYENDPRSQPIHRRVASGDITPISPQWPTHRSSQRHSGLGVPITQPHTISSARADEDAESDSGLGHVQEKSGSVKSMPSFDNLPRPYLPPTRQPARHRSFPLSRWSGWFTSSTRSSSESSRHNAPSPLSIPIVSPRPVRVYPPASVLARAHLRDNPSQRSSSIIREDALLDIPRTSPFEVDFEKRGEMYPSMISDMPRSIQSGSLGAQARDFLVSFLDFASSSAASIREPSRSRSRRQSSSNKSITHSANEPRSPQGSSGQSQSASTGMWTLSLSVDPPRRPARESQELVPTTAVDTVASTRHPFSMVSADLQMASPDSPTESLPMSVSDINFRNDEETESPLTDRSPRTLLPRHPPLPGTPHSYTFTPTVRPPEFARANHMRQMSAPNLNAPEPRRPYIAQTSFGRRLAQARAQALESQASLGSTFLAQSSSPSTSEHPVTQPSSSRLRTLPLPLPFIHFNRSASGS